MSWPARRSHEAGSISGGPQIWSMPKSVQYRRRAENLAVVVFVVVVVTVVVVVIGVVVVVFVSVAGLCLELTGCWMCGTGLGV